MRTRAQVNAWKEVTAQHRRDTAVFAAAIATSRRLHATPQHAPDADPSNAPSAASYSPLEATQTTPITPFTPEKTTRKRKLRSCSPSCTSPPPPAVSSPPSLPPTAESTDISPAARCGPHRHLPAERSAKRQASSPTPTTATKASTIRRTLAYESTNDTNDINCKAVPVNSAPAPTPTLTSPRAVLQRIVCGSDAAITSPSLFVGRAEERLQIERVFAPLTPHSPLSPTATRALFVLGPPGTGKSSCVAYVTAQHSTTTKVVRINCSTFASPSALLEAISEQLVAHNMAPPLPSLDHTQALDTFLTTAIHRAVPISRCDGVVVLDEVDCLVRLPTAILKRQAQHLLRFFVRWANLPNATVRFVGILNGVDMHTQIASVLAQNPHPTSVVLFPSYSLSELVAILTAYVQTATDGRIPLGDVVEPRAVELIARKVAARDGDARRAIGLLRQCARSSLSQIETITRGEASTVVRLTVRDVLKCTTAAIASQLSVVKQIEQLPRAPKLLLYAITRLTFCDNATVTPRHACDELEMLQATTASLAWIPRFRLEDVQQHMGALECYALIKQTVKTKTSSAWLAKCTSTVTMDVLTKAFQDDPLLHQLPTQ